MKQLFAEGAIAQQKLEEVEMLANAAREKYLAAAAQFKMGKLGARDESKQAAQALVNQAQSGLSEVSAYEKDLIVRAPVDGEVFGLPHQVGELVPQGYPLVTMIALDNVWINVQIPETKLLGFSKDKLLTVKIPALGDKTMQAKVSYIAAMPAYATTVFTQQRSSFDLRTFEVRLTPVAQIPDLRPGMTAVIAE